MSDPAARPLLRVVRGDATAAETAALVAALAITHAAGTRAAARADAGSGAADGSAESGWRDRSRLLRAPMPHGPGRWRASAQPR